MAALWEIAPCSPVEAARLFRGAYCLHHQCMMEEAVRISETSVFRRSHCFYSRTSYWPKYNLTNYSNFWTEPFDKANYVIITEEVLHNLGTQVKIYLNVNPTDCQITQLKKVL
jgi:hypothetical protein